jgi:hypothetical protein
VIDSISYESGEAPSTMAEALGVAASVAGLLSAGAKLIKVMKPIVSNADAPPLCSNVLTELCDVTATLHQIQHFLAGRLPNGGPVPSDRRECVPAWRREDDDPVSPDSHPTGCMGHAAT